jgi:hypothetical protein
MADLPLKYAFEKVLKQINILANNDKFYLSLPFDF